MMQRCVTPAWSESVLTSGIAFATARGFIGSRANVTYREEATAFARHWLLRVVRVA